MPEERDHYTTLEWENSERLIPIKLLKPYITKKLEASAFKTILASTYQTAYRLYLITSGIKEVQPFYEFSHPDYYITATVKTIAAPAGEVRSQVWNVKHLTPLLRKKPRYLLKCNVIDKITNKIIYRSEITSIKKQTIYNQIQECVSELDSILI
tara:strand:+ start:79 stop:540 length:462 start_codon:yes stop_codon:yes gene_type:complete